MRIGNKNRSEAAKAEFTLYPFSDLTDDEVRRQARSYIRTRLVEVKDMRAAPGESEYVTRSTKLPDRRLTFPDMRLQMRLRRHSKNARQQQEQQLQEVEIATGVANIALQQVMPEIAPIIDTKLDKDQ